MNENRDRAKFNAILLVIAMLIVMACTLAVVTVSEKMTYIERTPVTCPIESESNLCYMQGG